MLWASSSATANGSIHFIARDQVNTLGTIGGTGLSPYEPAAPTSFWRKFDRQGIVASTGASITVSSDSAPADDLSEFISGQVGGKLTLADGSTTIVTIDGSDGNTLSADQVFVKSSIDAVARQIVVGNADLEAKGGNIRFRARENFNEFSAFTADPIYPLNTSAPPTDSGIFIGDGARIDASGTNATKSVADLFIEVELRGDEFANNPLQRNGILRGKTAWVDIRDAIGIADLSGWISKVGQSVYEKAATGGTISLGTTGSLIVKSGAELDVSGGKISYAADTVQESRAVSASGKRYRLNDAPSSLRYGRLLTKKHKEAAYVEGRSAGTVELIAHNLAVDGQLRARTTVGTRQRDIGDASTKHYATPYGGQLIVKDAGQHYAVSDPNTATDEEKLAASLQAQIAFVKGAATAASGLTENSVAGPQLQLSQSLVDNGFSRFDISSDGRIDIPADVSLKLPVGGSFTASGRQIYVAGDISAPSGTIALTTRDQSGVKADARYSTLTLASTAALSAAGRWVNDYLDGRRTTRAKAVNGGSISLTSAYDLDLREGSQVDVSGGGWVSYAKKLTAGNAGSITVATGGVDDSVFGLDDFTARDATLFLDGELAGYALGKGGALTVKTSKIAFGDAFTQDSRDWSPAERLAKKQVGAAFAADFLDQGGFFSFSFVGRDGVTVADGVRLSPDPLSWSLASKRSNFLRQKTGSTISDFAQTAVLHPDLRGGSTNISLATRSGRYGDLLIGENAYLGVSPQGAIDLASWRQLTVLGTLEAPAGSINLSRPAIVVDPYNQAPLSFSEERQSESIYLGPNSRLLAGGTTVLNARTRRALESGSSVEQLLGQSAYRGSVLNGGAISIDAGLGYLVTRSGSLIDVSGATETLNQADLTSATLNYPVKTVGSAGGTVSLAAHEGMILDGSYRASGGKNALGGTFALRFSDISAQPENPWNIDTATATSAAEIAALADRQLTVYQSAGAHAELWPTQITGANYLAGVALIDAASHNGKAALDVAPLVSGGFGSWSLTSQDEMRFSGAISASVSNQLRLDAPKFSATKATQLSLAAATVQIGNYSEGAGAPTPQTNDDIGNAVAQISAIDIGLAGTFGWNGFGRTTFTSQGEIHFDSIKNTLPGRREYNGQMTTSGDLTFAAARLSPSTYSDFRVDLTTIDPNGSITVTRPAGSAADVSLSVGGRLELAAKTIYDDGTISAPLGEIVFTAKDGKVTLGANSVTSVAADRDLLFGYTTESVSNWNYHGSKVTAMPAKGIRIDGYDTVVASDAKLDLSGGGDALAYEFTAGPGGKTDVLLPSATTFAIIPGWSGATSTDSSLLSTSTLKVGDSIALAANSFGLAGTYVLLPARYAVLKGAYLVTVKTTDGTVMRRSTTQADGTQLLNATRQALNANGTTTPYSTTAWTVELANSSQVANRAKYTTTSASQFFYDQTGATLAGDAGQLTAIGRHSLVFDPTVVAMRAAEIAAADGRTRAGRGLQLDLAAPKLLVSDGAAAADASWSVLDQNKLNAIGAASLLIGGVRSVSGTTTTIDSIAADVRISNSGSTLTGSELLLAATDKIAITDGSRVESSGSRTDSRAIVLSGDGAFVRAAEGEQATLSRTGPLTRARGDLVEATGAHLAGQSLILDATHTNTLAGSIFVGQRQGDGSRSSGGAIAIGAGRINVVGDGSTPADGLTLGNADLQRWAAADQIRLTSYSTLDLYGNAQLGTASLKELIIAAAGIAGHGSAANTTTIAAQSVGFENPNPASASFIAGAIPGSGTLAVNAQTITFGDNATAAMRAPADSTAAKTGFAIRGFATANLAATGDLRFSGTGVTAIDNDMTFVGGSGQLAALNIDAGRVLTVSTADQLLSASGATTITRNASATASSVATGLGGNLELAAKSVDVSGTISAAAGTLTLSGTDYVKVRSGAYVAAEGSKVAFDDIDAYGSGGAVTLKSSAGNVSVDSGAVVSVSADAAGGNAGTLSLVAQNGAVTAAAGTLRGSANANAKQGTLKVDASSVHLDALATAVVNGARTELRGAWDVRARSGDLTLSNTITAQDVSIAADNGGVTVAGTGVIDASGAKGGDIALYSKNGDIVLDGSLLARGQQVIADTDNAGTRGQGGSVLLAASGTRNGNAAKVMTNAGSLIDVSVADGSLAKGGKVNFRAAKTTATSFDNASDLNIALAGAVTGASDVGVEIFSTYVGTGTTTTLNAASTSTAGATIGLKGISTALTSLYTTANVDAIRSLLGSTFTGANSHVRAGAEITSTGNLTVGATSADLDLAELRTSGGTGFLDEAGVLTLRAQKDLSIKGSISDGFVDNDINLATSRDAIIGSSDASWSYRLVAGADIAAANPLAVKAPAPLAGANVGNIAVATGKLVRTGTGDISLAAQGDITLANRAVVYTAGRESTTSINNFNQLTADDGVTGGNGAHFPFNGGDLDISAGGKIVQANTGAVSDWLIGYSSSFNTTAWWARIASFQQGFGALGGGDIRLASGGDMTKVTAVIPTNGRVPGINGEARGDLAVINGGGDLSVKSGGSINGGLFYVESGRLDLTAGENIQKSGTNTTLGLGNTVAAVSANGSIALGSMFNPLDIAKTSNRFKQSDGSAMDDVFATDETYNQRIGTYTDNTRVDVVSLSGDVLIDSSSLGTTSSVALSPAPAKISAAALNGDITVSLLQAPGSLGQLDLLAWDSITLKVLKQYDLPAARLSSITHPIVGQLNSPGQTIVDPYDNGLSTRYLHSASLWHANDYQPSRVIALTGDITGGTDANSQPLTFDEAVTIKAGGDIINVNPVIQHAHASDVSRIVAGGNIRYGYRPSSVPGTTISQNLVAAGVSVSGPGAVEVIAGKSIDFADSWGIVTRGNLDNPFLPEGGASILAMAGGMPDYASLRAYLKADAEVSDAELRGQFFTLLKTYGTEAQSGGGDASYEKGRALARAFFPTATTDSGDVKLSVSQIKTEQGGDIELLAPGGSVIVGVAAPALTKAPSQQGIFTVDNGNIFAYVDNNFLVNQSRAFTLNGGDITIWANHGNIDAGSGSKTKVSTPPPVLVIRDGQAVLDTSNAVTGSGIGVLASKDDTPASDMSLFAPEGSIDAGDAGLRSTGNITLGARTILNASNIQAAGAVSGAPAPVAAAAPAVTPTTPTTSEKADTQAASAIVGNREAALGVLTVEVLDGGESAEATTEKDDDKKKKR